MVIVSSIRRDPISPINDPLISVPVSTTTPAPYDKKFLVVWNLNYPSRGSYDSESHCVVLSRDRYE
ncbi:hypothetical protein KIN20_034607 [Parelaphostrongylus tenuis]|uniref:Uncharacterized protein n=1 Tax=Parelaphostrongylus tenuis TaxID=148309 RepID=A0AAD5WJ39_PARTN|nr:hypothetical protein KIN20_034607 [Parelaphostrongylus tenuis]